MARPSTSTPLLLLLLLLLLEAATCTTTCEASFTVEEADTLLLAPSNCFTSSWAEVELLRVYDANRGLLQLKRKVETLGTEALEESLSVRLDLDVCTEHELVMELESRDEAGEARVEGVTTTYTPDWLAVSEMVGKVEHKACRNSKGVRFDQDDFITGLMSQGNMLVKYCYKGVKKTTSSQDHHWNQSLQLDVFVKGREVPFRRDVHVRNLGKCLKIRRSPLTKWGTKKSGEGVAVWVLLAVILAMMLGTVGFAFKIRKKEVGTIYTNPGFEPTNYDNISESDFVIDRNSSFRP